MIHETGGNRQSHRTERRPRERAVHFQKHSEAEAKANAGLKVVCSLGRLRKHHKRNSRWCRRKEKSQVPRRHSPDRVTGVKPNDGAFRRIELNYSAQIECEVRTGNGLQASEWRREDRGTPSGAEN